MRSPSTHFMLALGVAVVTVSGYIAWFYFISQKSSDVASLQSQIVTETGNVNRIAAARAALSEIAGDEANVQSYFISESEVVTFINSLEALGLAQKATVNVLSVSTGGTSVQPTLLLALTVQGTFDAVMRTIGAIEYAPYDVAISKFGVQQDAKDSWNATLSLVVGSASIKAAASTP